MLEGFFIIKLWKDVKSDLFYLSIFLLELAYVIKFTAGFLSLSFHMLV